MGTRSRQLIGVLFFVLAWEWLATSVHSPMLVAPVGAISAFGRILPELLYHASVSVRTIFLGFALAVVTAIPLGIAAAKSKAVTDLTLPVLNAVRYIAALAFFPLLILTMGLGVESRSFVIFWTAWPAILFNTIHGIVTVDHELCEAAMLEGATGMAILRHIEIPLAMPAVVAGIRIGSSGGGISLVSAEMLGSNAGLGFAVLAYSQTFRFAEMYATILMIGIVGYLFNLSISLFTGSAIYEVAYRIFGSRLVSRLRAHSGNGDPQSRVRELQSI